MPHILCREHRNIYESLTVRFGVVTVWIKEIPIIGGLLYMNNNILIKTVRIGLI